MSLPDRLPDDLEVTDLPEEDAQLHVLLDTEVLRRDPLRRTGAFRALARLASNGHVCLHLSEVSIREFITARGIEARETRGKFSSALSTARRFLGDRWPSSLEGIVQEAMDAVLGPSFDADERAAMDSWCSEHDVQVHPVREGHGNRVVDAYFTGGAPFRAAKQRDDFPDAFVHAVLADQASERSHVYFVTGDKRLLEASRLLPRVSVAASIDELLQLPALRAALEEDILTEQLARVGRELPTVLAGHLPHLLAGELSGRRVAVHYPVAGVASIESTDGAIQGLFEEPCIYYGAGIVMVPFSARMRSTLVLTCPRGGVDTAKLAGLAEVRSQDDNTLTVSLVRTIVVAGTLLVAVPGALLEASGSDNAVASAVAQMECVMNELAVDGGRNSPPYQTVLRHAQHQAKLELAAGDRDISLNPGEEADRAAQAQWVDIPPELHGTHGGLTVAAGSRMKIAPLPRFEVLVRVAKALLIEKALHDATEQGADTAQPPTTGEHVDDTCAD